MVEQGRVDQRPVRQQMVGQFPGLWKGGGAVNFDAFMRAALGRQIDLVFPFENKWIGKMPWPLQDRAKRAGLAIAVHFGSDEMAFAGGVGIGLGEQESPAILFEKKGIGVEGRGVDRQRRVGAEIEVTDVGRKIVPAQRNIPVADRAAATDRPQHPRRHPPSPCFQQPRRIERDRRPRWTVPERRPLARQCAPQQCLDTRETQGEPPRQRAAVAAGRVGRGQELAIAIDDVEQWTFAALQPAGQCERVRHAVIKRPQHPAVSRFPLLGKIEGHVEIALRNRLGRTCRGAEPPERPGIGGGADAGDGDVMPPRQRSREPVVPRPAPPRRQE